MNIYLVYACEQHYGGLHGMYDYNIIETDSEEELNEIGAQMSCEVMESYSGIMEELEEEVAESVNRDVINDDEYWDNFNNVLSDLIIENECYEFYKLDTSHTLDEYIKMTETMDWTEIVEQFGVDE